MNKERNITYNSSMLTHLPQIEIIKNIGEISNVNNYINGCAALNAL